MVGEAAKLPRMVWEAPKRPKTPAFCIFSGLFWDILGARNGRGGCQIAQNGLESPKKARNCLGRCLRARARACVCWCLRVLGFGVLGLGMFGFGAWVWGFGFFGL